jgi:hypothetical protein
MYWRDIRSYPNDHSDHGSKPTDNSVQRKLGLDDGNWLGFIGRSLIGGSAFGRELKATIT